MRGHDGALSAVPYFFNLGLVKAAISASCHFADLGGNNTVVRQELALEYEAQAAGRGDCSRLRSLAWHGVDPGR